MKKRMLLKSETYTLLEGDIVTVELADREVFIDIRRIKKGILSAKIEAYRLLPYREG